MGSPRSFFDWLPGSKKALNNMSWPEGKHTKEKRARAEEMEKQDWHTRNICKNNCNI